VSWQNRPHVFSWSSILSTTLCLPHSVEKEVVTPNRNLNQSSSAWRPTLRNTPASATGSFEGVLGSFGGGVSTPSKQKNGIESGSTDQIATPSAWKERERVTSANDLAAGIMPGSGGGPGWGKTGRWRSAAQQQEDEDAMKVGREMNKRISWLFPD